MHRLVLVALLFCWNPLLAQDGDWRSVADEVAAELPRGGIMVVRFAGNEVDFHGVSANDSKPDPDTLFEVGSITKLFTGLLYAVAVSEEVIDPLDPIAKYLPEGFSFSHQETAQIPMLALAIHTSGLPRLPGNLPDLADPENPYADYSVEDLYAYLATSQPDPQQAGQHAYSNLGSGLLGHLLARAYGSSFEEILRQKVLDPLGLQDTAIELDDDQRARLATPFDGERAVPAWEYASLSAAGGVRSSARDLGILLRALLNPDGSPLRDEINLLKSVQCEAPEMGGLATLGLYRINKYGRDRFFKDGSTGGCRAALAVTPGTRSGFAVLVNNAIGADQLVDSLWKLEALAGPDSAQEAPRFNNPVEYVGMFRIHETAEFLLGVYDGRLYARLTGQLAFPLHPKAVDRFAYANVPAEIQFQRNENGSVNELILVRDGRETSAKRTSIRMPYTLYLGEELASEYEGSYALEDSQLIQVEAIDGQIAVAVGGNRAAGVLCKRPDYFEFDVFKAALTFERDENDQVVAVTLHNRGENLRAKRVLPEN